MIDQLKKNALKKLSMEMLSISPKIEKEDDAKSLEEQLALFNGLESTTSKSLGPEPVKPQNIINKIKKNISRTDQEKQIIKKLSELSESVTSVAASHVKRRKNLQNNDLQGFSRFDLQSSKTKSLTLKKNAKKSSEPKAKTNQKQGQKLEKSQSSNRSEFTMYGKYKCVRSKPWSAPIIKSNTGKDIPTLK